MNSFTLKILLTIYILYALLKFFNEDERSLYRLCKVRRCRRQSL
jgi:hypothetical protein